MLSFCFGLYSCIRRSSQEFAVSRTSDCSLQFLVVKDFLTGWIRALQSCELLHELLHARIPLTRCYCPSIPTCEGISETATAAPLHEVVGLRLVDADSSRHVGSRRLGRKRPSRRLSADITRGAFVSEASRVRGRRLFSWDENGNQWKPHEAF